MSRFSLSRYLGMSWQGTRVISYHVDVTYVVGCLILNERNIVPTVVIQTFLSEDAAAILTSRCTESTVHLFCCLNQFRIISKSLQCKSVPRY